MVWRGKDQQDQSDLLVQAPPLYIQEKVHPKALIDDLLRSTKAREHEAGQTTADLFADFNGIHSYLNYLRDRLTVARDLLTESGSIFVQIGDENVHRVRAVMDEVFGKEISPPSVRFERRRVTHRNCSDRPATLCSGSQKNAR